MKSLEIILLLAFAWVVFDECTAPITRKEPLSFYADGHDMHTYEGLQKGKEYKRQPISIVANEEYVKISFLQIDSEATGTWNYKKDKFNGVGEQGEKIRLEFTETTLKYTNNGKVRHFKKLKPLRK